MGNKLYVGNLPYSFRDEDLQQHFGAHGTVTSAKVMMDRDTGRSKGFGLGAMGDDAQGDSPPFAVDSRALLLPVAGPHAHAGGPAGARVRHGRSSASLPQTDVRALQEDLRTHAAGARGAREETDLQRRVVGADLRALLRARVSETHRDHRARAETLA